MCSGLSLIFQIDASVAALPGLQLKECRSLTNVDLTRTSVLRIGQRFLNDCYRLKSVKLPPSFMQVGDYFLSNCAHLQSMDLRQTELTRTGAYFLYDCWSLTSVQLPPCITEVGGNFLSKCGHLGCIDLRQTQLTRGLGRFSLPIAPV